ncbi:hypothetical protein VP01_1496g5 [Puccinia sorghi]|uniref:Uncharacterized protein n=1 Tax=Puccinia sorghi TaxID=27349 RepID=A0A0L6VJC2_9BASI|nr:hypothetical protein VP01_1496g5 [Puccinia sorghi]
MKAILSNESSEAASGSGILQSNIQFLANLLNMKNGHWEASPGGQSDAPISSPPNESLIEGYVDLLGICDQDHTIKILLANGCHSHISSQTCPQQF